MRESLMYGSVRGARGNSRPYRDTCSTDDARWCQGDVCSQKGAEPPVGAARGEDCNEHFKTDKPGRSGCPESACSISRALPSTTLRRPSTLFALRHYVQRVRPRRLLATMSVSPTHA